MLSIVTGTFRLFASRWPALIAIFLAGWALRFVLIRFAGFAGNIDPLLGMLLLPVAVLVRLASYVAMFLVLRDAMPTFRTISESRLTTEGTRPQRFTQILGSSILGFFVVFATWNMLKDDYIDYSNSQLEQWDPFETDLTASAPAGSALDIPVSFMTVSIVVIAYILRVLIKKYSKRLPLWTSYLAVYLEAVWIFLAVIVLQSLLSFVPAWVQSRVVVVWALDVIETARGLFAPLRWLIDGWSWLAEQAGIVIVLPLAWLALAGVVYSKALDLKPPLHEIDYTVVKTVRGRYERVPRFVRKRISSLADGTVSRWKPIADSARLIWSAGILAMAVFVLSYAVLDTSTLWILQGFYRLLGPHELGWWFATDNQISLVADAIVEPLRLCLIAAAYDYGLRATQERDARKARADLATAAAATETATGAVATAAGGLQSDRK
ncbi:MAG: hypothetical protein ACOH19_04120 [Rhodoglobus sp.]